MYFVIQILSFIFILARHALKSRCLSESIGVWLQAIEDVLKYNILITWVFHYFPEKFECGFLDLMLKKKPGRNSTFCDG